MEDNKSINKIAIIHRKIAKINIGKNKNVNAIF